MPEQGEKLESWKQIAAYMGRSERTVRRWEVSESLPVHRHDHGKGDTVVAYASELDAWRARRTKPSQRQDPELSTEPRGRRWMLGSGLAAGAGAVALHLAGSDSEESGPSKDRVEPERVYLSEHEAITRTLDRCIAGCQSGNGDIMRAAFHSKATVSGFAEGVDYSGPAENLFTWVDENGPAPDIEPRIVRIEVLESIAIVHVDIRRFSGHLVGPGASVSDVFTLLKCDGEWKISQKAFHWYQS